MLPSRVRAMLYSCLQTKPLVHFPPDGLCSGQLPFADSLKRLDNDQDHTLHLLKQSKPTEPGADMVRTAQPGIYTQPLKTRTGH